MNQSQQPKYQIYPSLMDSYTSYINSGDIYDKYWGGSANPPLSYEEFVQRQFDDLIDKINRVPKDLPKADVGTVFNEIVDCMLLGRKSERIEVEKIYKSKVSGAVDECGRVIGGDVEMTGEVGWLRAHYNGRSFVYPIEMCREFAEYYKGEGAIPQMFVEGLIDTPRGLVRLYGYADEVTSCCVHDIKTTGIYEAWKFKGNAQHLVYPYCLQLMGIELSDFSYDVAVISTNIKGDYIPDEIVITHLATTQETYTYQAHRDIPIIQERLCELIDFIEAHRHMITNDKIFGL